MNRNNFTSQDHHIALSKELVDQSVRIPMDKIMLVSDVKSASTSIANQPQFHRSQDKLHRTRVKVSYDAHSFHIRNLGNSCREKEMPLNPEKPKDTTPNVDTSMPGRESSVMRLDTESAFVEKIGQYIRLVREKDGYTRRQLAVAIGLPVQAIVAIENGIGSPKTATFLYLQVKQLRGRSINDR